jgi:hypothetical protein
MRFDLEKWTLLIAYLSKKLEPETSSKNRNWLHTPCNDCINQKHQRYCRPLSLLKLKHRDVLEN